MQQSYGRPVGLLLLFILIICAGIKKLSVHDVDIHKIMCIINNISNSY